ncbi:MAG: hypothetical protein PHT77_05390 [Bacteroidales bacterium]|nr:hypothetical protein [Bacteroidales bacterium]
MEKEKKTIIALFIAIFIVSVCLGYALTLSYPTQIDDVTILDKTSNDGLLRKEFFIVTDYGKYEVAILGGNEMASHKLWSYFEVGHKYNLIVSMGMVVGVGE